MTQNTPQPPQDDPPIINYDTPVKRSKAIVALFKGGVAGVAIILFAGCGAFNFIGYPYIAGPSLPSSGRPHAAYLSAILFFLLTAASVAGFIAAFRSPQRRWFMMGLCFGIGLMSLLEGLCFTNS